MTLRDIAKALNLSTSTVSKALRDSYEIGEDTKKRVIAYAEQVGYQPNTLAKSLKEGKSRTIGVVICAIDNSFVSQMLNGIDRACNERGYSIMIMQSKESHVQEIKCTEVLYGRSIDGLLISPACETPNVDHLKKFQQLGLPIVLFDRYSDELDVPRVSINNLDAAYQATEHLIKNGYTRIAVLHSNTSLNINIQRLEGYKKALRDHRIELMDEYIQPCNLQTTALLEESIHQAMQKLSALTVPPTALLTLSDQISTSSISILQEMGYQIPQDMALIGFTNTSLANSLHPPLSTIYQPAIAIGEAAANRLIDIIEGTDEEEKQTVYLAAQLHERASSRRLV
ncbi:MULTISPECIES: LacI family DNA-binding transcriptional regulator [Olivibacter]|uniref:Transcriptional regulator, LacI family n=3 Tax=Sphingobacteriaceae TaxID=84566 RepID=F4C819_SPHS2|nr:MULTISPECIES: LacI family DNA-binding transcriptional regulator [Olivibacter]MCL4640520.1 LacI family transcriptional regulator [Olivibacter sp. UJ_SKK_5.1]MDM8172742.1 LacI family DNA-binding transcriptional regulator [Olivibacter sp. 47]MDX3917052.1 LacI family DNA-binding transcriptional regulator [Pseudosphingobacterium sp.]QEL04203.1 LacI family transcriptional regulator [Olivibacter sp. LS-1]